MILIISETMVLF